MGSLLTLTGSRLLRDVKDRKGKVIRDFRKRARSGLDKGGRWDTTDETFTTKCYFCYGSLFGMGFG